MARSKSKDKILRHRRRLRLKRRLKRRKAERTAKAAS
jgi:hypothetical protein